MAEYESDAVTHGSAFACPLLEYASIYLPKILVPLNTLGIMPKKLEYVCSQRKRP